MVCVPRVRVTTPAQDAFDSRIIMAALPMVFTRVGSSTGVGHRAPRAGTRRDPARPCIAIATPIAMQTSPML